MKQYRWAILGTGKIAHSMAPAIRKAGGILYSAANRTAARAEEFAREFGIPRVYQSVDEVFRDSGVDVIYIATTHNAHASQIRQAVSQGKHVLCEKAITQNSGELSEALELARQNGAVVMEGMTIYHMPLIQRLREIVAAGEIGPVKLVQVNFGSLFPLDPSSRYLSRELGGGALLDLGVYALSFARLFLSSDPDEVLTTANLFETGTDEQSGILLKNPDGQMAAVTLSMRAKQPKRGVVSGEAGYIEVENYNRADRAVIVYSKDGRREELRLGDAEDAFFYEARDMMRAIEAGEDPYLPYTKSVMDVITRVQELWNRQR